MKVLFFISDFKVGVTSLLAEQAIALSKVDRLNMYFIGGTNEQEPGLVDRLHQQHIKPILVDRLDEHCKLLAKAKVLKQVISEIMPDYVHVQNNWQLLLVSLIKFFGRQPFKVIYTIHGYRHNYYFRSFLARWLIIVELLLLSNTVIITSSFVKKKFPLVRFKSKIAFLGTDPAFFSKNDVPNIDPLAVNMVFAGQFRHGKNQDLLIQAFHNFVLTSGNKSFNLILPGEGPLKQHCVDLVNHLHLNDRVYFPGQLSRKEMVNLYFTSNIAVVPSNSETFGQCISEPFVTGLCVISRRVGVAEDIIDHEKNGFLYSSAAELENILLHLEHHPELIAAAGRMALKTRMKFSWDHIAHNFITIYG